jgi:hypothetical protein
MDNSLYIRVRGRVLGPYDQEKLQSLARRGQLSRMHELSVDGASWVRASNYPELFTGSPVEMPTDHRIASDSAATGVATAATAPAAAQTAGPTSGRWHYTSAGVQRGPVDFANLQLLCASGQITPDDLVWSDGMPAWIPASQIPGLVRTTATAAATFDGASDRTDTGGLPDRVYRAAYSSKPWVLFIAIATSVFAALQAIGGMWLLIMGARARSESGVISGIISLVAALDGAVGVYLLYAYVSRMNSLQYSPKPVVLEKVHDAVRGYWIYLAINLIAAITLFGFFVIVVFAGLVTFPYKFD